VTGLLVFGTWRACSKLFLRTFKPWVSSFGSPWDLVAFELLVLVFTVLPAACMSCSVPCAPASARRILLGTQCIGPGTAGTFGAFQLHPELLQPHTALFEKWPRRTEQSCMPKLFQTVVRGHSVCTGGLLRMTLFVDSASW